MKQRPLTEQEYKELIYEKAKEIKTKQDLDALLDGVINDKELDYGKICYAISGCMLATLNYIDGSEVGGITGFQASIIGWQMVRELIVDSEIGMKLVDYGNMLFPQYEHEFEKTIPAKIWEKIQEQAKQNLQNVPDAHSDVIKHWKKIAAGEVPFGYKVKE